MRTLFILCVVSTMGCKSITNEQRYVNYINDPKNNITQQLKVGEVQATVKWMPPAYMKLKSQLSQEVSTDNDDYYFFDVKFDKTVGDKPPTEKQRYLDFDIQKDFVLLDGKDSIAPLICQKIENGIGGSYQYMLVFGKDEGDAEQDFTVIYSDKVFGIGTMAFVYNQEDISKMPKLKSEETK